MRAFFLLALFLPATAFAAPPRVRLLSVADGTARIRVGDGSAETRISSLVHSLHSAGITSFIFEANSDILLTKLRSRWLDTGIRNVTILPPAPPSAANYPKLDPIEAGVAKTSSILSLKTASPKTMTRSLRKISFLKKSELRHS